ncbi:Death domain-associated protein 6 [Trichoplax sp. H2]|nr:Death domain-associated protein 6 [Trichoplax sp. H2]|eukprot:RDD44415.1 Death domain-associated protein 6 [Trichoplax sp. H2]
MESDVIFISSSSDELDSQPRSTLIQQPNDVSGSRSESHIIKPDTSHLRANTAINTNDPSEKLKLSSSYVCPSSSSSSASGNVTTRSTEVNETLPPNTTLNDGDNNIQSDQLPECGSDLNVEWKELLDDQTLQKLKKYETDLRKYNKLINKHEYDDMSLEDLDNSGSIYILISKLKKKSVAIVEKMNKLVRSRSVLEPPFRQFCNTRYRDINKEVTKFLKAQYYRNHNSTIKSRAKHRKQQALLVQSLCMPDFVDIKDIVTSANRKYKLGLTQRQHDDIAKEAFREVCHKIRKRRLEELNLEIRHHLKPNEQDPAINNPTLKEDLDKSLKIGQEREKEVILKFSKIQDDIRDNKSEPSEESEDETNTEEENSDIDEEKLLHTLKRKNDERISSISELNPSENEEAWTIKRAKLNS